MFCDSKALFKLFFIDFSFFRCSTIDFIIRKKSTEKDEEKIPLNNNELPDSNVDTSTKQC